MTTPQQREQINNYQQVDRLLVAANKCLQTCFKKHWEKLQGTPWSDGTENGEKLYNLVKNNVEMNHQVALIRKVIVYLNL